MSPNPYLHRHTKGVKRVTVVIVLIFFHAGNKTKTKTNVAQHGWETESQEHIWKGGALGLGLRGVKVNQA